MHLAPSFDAMSGVLRAENEGCASRQGWLRLLPHWRLVHPFQRRWWNACLGRGLKPAPRGSRAHLPLDFVVALFVVAIRRSTSMANRTSTFGWAKKPRRCEAIVTAIGAVLLLVLLLVYLFVLVDALACRMKLVLLRTRRSKWMTF